MIKIYCNDIPKIFQPEKTKLKFPRHSNSYGIEQDFHNFLMSSPCLVDAPDEADFIYLPIYWTNYNLNNDYGKKGRNELEKFLETQALGKNSFTICQYADGPLINTKDMQIFQASRKNEESGIHDVPLLVNYPKILPTKKRFDVNFIGNPNTHPLREKSLKIAKKFESSNISTRNISIRKYTKILAQSKITLCPRGYGGNSFRFFEAMRQGSYPILIGDLDTRPFKQFINVDKFSSFVNDINQLEAKIEHTLEKWNEETAKEVKKSFYRYYEYNNWPFFVLMELIRQKYEC